jgi:glutathione synthase/RimK-type ligase-like ATP-grasp enzyme
VLAENAIAVPDTVFTMPSRLKNSYSLYKEKLGLPFVLKDIHASRGAMNEVIRNQEDFNALIARAEASEEHHYFVGQAFVPNDGDYRVLVFGGKVSLAIHRKRADDSTHLNNTSQGGTAVIVPLSEFPEQVLEDSRRAATSHELGIAGVDMVKDKETGRWYCFEVNESPQITTGSHSHAKWDGLASYLMTELENK